MNQNAKIQRKNKRDQEDRAFNRVLIWFACAVVVEAVLLGLGRVWPASAAVEWLTILVPVAAVLALVYYLFQRDFFYITLISACGILSIQLYRKMYWLHPTRIKCGYGLAFVLLAAAVVLLIVLQRRDGVLPAKGLRMLPKDANYILLYITCGLNALLLVLTLALGGTVPYYLIFVLVGWLFIMAVYYIVKLM